MTPGRGLRIPRSAVPSSVEVPLTVHQLTRRIRSLLEGEVGRVTVEGEIGALTRAASGHLYLTLKDGHAVLDVVMWRSAAQTLRTVPAEGTRVLVRGEVTVYEPRGRYQLVAQSIRPAGKGDLQAQFEARVARLREEGLFDPAHKKPLPPMPQTIGIVTSPTGAAIRDLLKILRKRMPGARIVLSPCVVQGTNAAEDVTRALRAIDAWGGCEVLIVGRGGGSAEDLAVFNDEAVARAVFACQTPVVSAVGHESDMSLTDLVADVRAATPSEAAEIVAPDMTVVQRRIHAVHRALAQALTHRVRDGQARWRMVSRSPAIRNPIRMVHLRRQRLDDTISGLRRALVARIRRTDAQVALLAARLEGLSPLGVLARGYSVTRTREGTVLRDADGVGVGMEIESILAGARIHSTITTITKEQAGGKAEGQDV